jgi:hypothetical protein
VSLAPVSHADDQLPPARPAAQLRSAGWVLRRALFGLVALSIFVISGAWLLHASIEPDSTTFAEQSQSE